MAETYLQKLAAGFQRGQHLCVGIDPHPYLLDAWGLDDSAASAEKFAREVIAQGAGHALAFKPQVAFFERFGAAGYVALERALDDARQLGAAVIADAKRGDIGTSFAAYADAWLTPGSPLEADALTVAAYQGFGSIAHAIELATAHEKGVFVLAATSNPEAKATQLARRADGQTVAASIVTAAEAANRDFARSGTPAKQSRCDSGSAATQSVPARPVGPVGVVLGATLKLAEFGIDTAHREKPQQPETAAVTEPALPVLAPGFGAQGADPRDAEKLFGRYAPSLIANESRSLLAGGSKGLRERIAQRAALIQEVMQS